MRHRRSDNTHLHLPGGSRIEPPKDWTLVPPQTPQTEMT